jgi:hypothetical protein
MDAVADDDGDDAHNGEEEGLERHGVRCASNGDDSCTLSFSMTAVCTMG